MKSHITFISTAAAILLLAGCRSGETAVQALPQLKVDGTVIMAGEDTLCLRGISYGWHNLWPRFYNSASVASLNKDWGCRIFRASIGADDLHETDDNTGFITNPDRALECLYGVIDGAIATGSYVLVDWHSHILHQKEAEDFFRTVATKYADCPNVIYELFNEPVSRAFEDHFSYADLGDQEALMSYWLELKAYAESLIQTITSISTVHPLILMGNPMWDQRPDLCAAAPIEGYDNVAYTVHFYAATHKDDLRARTDEAIAAGIPVFLSECAACEASGNGEMDLESWDTWSEWAAERHISMLTWSIGDKNETCSMFTPEASSEGPWGDDVIKPWGLKVREWINEK